MANTMKSEFFTRHPDETIDFDPVAFDEAGLLKQIMHAQAAINTMLSSGSTSPELQNELEQLLEETKAVSSSVGTPEIKMMPKASTLEGIVLKYNEDVHTAPESLAGSSDSERIAALALERQLAELQGSTIKTTPTPSKPRVSLVEKAKRQIAERRSASPTSQPDSTNRRRH